VHPGVYRLAGTPPSWVGDVWAAVLATGSGATVTHETALALHGSAHVPRRPITLTAEGAPPARALAGVVVRSPGRPPPARVAAPGPGGRRPGVRVADISVVEGLPVSTPARALVEVAGRLGRRTLGRTLDDLVFARRTTYAAVGTCLARAGPAAPGAATLARVLDERSDAAVPAASELERGLFAALAAGGLPPPCRQMRLPGRGAVPGTVDAAYADCRLILEADGRRWHTRVADLRRDHERDAEAARVGWQTLRFLYEQVVGDPAGVCAVVADVRAVRGGGGGR
jgi:hypothetical protein